MPESKGPRGYLAKYGAQVLANGYEIIPIKRGTKRPPVDGWQKFRANEALLAKWIAGKVEGIRGNEGLGILTRLTPLVDLDIPDETISRKMERFVQENFGLAPVRVGLYPKKGLLFRSSAPFTKVQSRTWVDEWADPGQDGKGQWRKVEILGDGQQFVALAIHPDTKEPYRWEDKESPVRIKAADLPDMTAENAARIVAEFERLAAEAGWEVKPGSSLARINRPVTGGVIDKDDVFASDAHRVEDVSEDELHRKLLLVPGAEDYETWLQIGMALYHQFEGDARGLELWHEWSSTAGNYDGEALDAKWDTFDIETKGRAPVTARLILKLSKEAAEEIATETFRDITNRLREVDDLRSLKTVCDEIKHIEFDMMHRAQIVALVQKRFKEIARAPLSISLARDMVRFENPEPKELPRWLEGWVYVAHRNVYYSTQTRVEMSPEAFNSVHNRFMLTKRDVLEGKAIPEVSATQFALNNKQIETVQLTMYLPGEDDIFWFNGIRCVNTYSERNIPTPPDKLTKVEREAVTTVKNHLSHLFENARDRRVLLDSLAFIVQNPGQRLKFGILMQGTEEDGKSFFAGLLAAVLGPDNLKNLSAQAMEEKYNGWAEGSQVVFFEEIKLHGHNRFDVLNKVKPLLTNPLISVRKMQTDIYEAVNTATYILTTNFRDALPLDDNDTRYFVMFSRFQRKEALQRFLETDPDYYARLYATLEHGGALRKWLLSHELSPEFNPNKRAPNSSAKAEMISYSRSAEDEAVMEILEESMDLDVGDILLDSAKLAERMIDKGADAPYGRSMSTLLLKHGFTRLGKVRRGDKTPLFWSRHPERFRDTHGDTNKVNAEAINAWLDSDL